MVVTFYKNDGLTKIGEGSGVWMDLKNIQAFYEHWTVGDNTVRGATVPATAFHPVGNNFEYGAEKPGLSVTSDTHYNDYILFVHGYRIDEAMGTYPYNLVFTA